MTDPIVGIDLGTSNTVVAHATAAGTAQVLADGSGFKIHPSVVSFHPSGGVVVGAGAKQRKVIDPKNTIFSVKRLIGRTFDSTEVKTARQRMPYQIKEGANRLPMIVTRGGEFAVPEISAIVLDHAKNVATTALGTPVSRAVVTVPASFNEAQRSATATAGSIAGLTIVRVLNEPTAAALAYGHTRNLRDTIAVYDFGGGTFDITILKLHDQVYEVLGTAGNSFLGGDDLDERLVDRMVEKFLQDNRVDLRVNEVSMMRLRAVAEQVKIELSRRSRAMVRVDEIAYGPNGKPLDLHIEIRRDEFVQQVADIVDRTFPVCDEALKLAGLTIDHIDDVILVGGTTKIPYVRDQVARFFAKAPRTDVNPEDAVAVGAALQAGALDKILRKPATAPTMAAQFDAQEGTFGGETATTEKPGRPGERTATRGEHVDVFEDRTPPPVSTTAPVIGRITKQITPPSDAKLPPPPPMRTQQLSPVARPPSRTSPTGIPLPPSTPPRRTSPTGIPSMPTVPRRTSPTGIPVLPSAPRRTSPTGIPLSPTGVPLPPSVPVAPPSAKTITIPPPKPSEPTIAVAPSPASTLRGIAPAPYEDDFSDLITKEPLASDFLDAGTETGIEELPLAPASTAKGFAPPTASSQAKTITAPPQAKTITAPPQPPPFAAPAFGTPSHAPTLVAAPLAAPVAAPAVTRPSPVVMDVTPRGLGIGTVAGFCEELIRRNSRVPTEIRKLFTTSRDSQDSVRIIVCQGESRRLDNNVVIADLRLEGLPPRPRGETSIEVTFALDANGILQVRARDPQTGREQRASLDIVGTIGAQDVAAAREKIAALTR